MLTRILRRYRFAVCCLIVVLIITIINIETGFKTFSVATSSFKQMISVLPPIMILLGLMDVWIPRESMIKYMGEDSGLLGIGLAMLIGSLAAGPMYAAFPFTAVLLRKGAKFSNIIIFMNAWCVTKIVTLMFEVTYLGYEFTLTRLLIDIPGVIIMGYLVHKLLPKEELDRIYLHAEELE